MNKYIVLGDVFNVFVVTQVVGQHHRKQYHLMYGDYTVYRLL